MGIQYRPGKKKDSNNIAELVDIVSGGAVEYLFHDLVPDMTPVQVVAHNLKNDYYPHSYKSTVVALDGQEIVGMALSYPSAFHKT